MTKREVLKDSFEKICCCNMEIANYSVAMRVWLKNLKKQFLQLPRNSMGEYKIDEDDLTEPMENLIAYSAAAELRAIQKEVELCFSFYVTDVISKKEFSETLNKLLKQSDYCKRLIDCLSTRQKKLDEWLEKIKDRALSLKEIRNNNFDSNDPRDYKFLYDKICNCRTLVFESLSKTHNWIKNIYEDIQNAEKNGLGRFKLDDKLLKRREDEFYAFSLFVELSTIFSELVSSAMFDKEAFISFEKMSLLIFSIPSRLKAIKQIAEKIKEPELSLTLKKFLANVDKLYSVRLAAIDKEKKQAEKLDFLKPLESFDDSSCKKRLKIIKRVIISANETIDEGQTKAFGEIEDIVEHFICDIIDIAMYSENEEIKSYMKDFLERLRDVKARLEQHKNDKNEW